METVVQTVAETVVERRGALSWLDREDQQLQRLRSSVSVCSQYVDDLMTSTSFQIAQSTPVNFTSTALRRLRQRRRRFLRDVADYIDSEKTRLGREIDGRADMNLTLSRLQTSHWLIYPRSLFHTASKHRPKDAVDGAAQFASFLTAGSVELDAVERWTSAGPHGW